MQIALYIAINFSLVYVINFFTIRNTRNPVNGFWITVGLSLILYASLIIENYYFNPDFNLNIIIFIFTGVEMVIIFFSAMVANWLNCKIMRIL